MEGGVGEASERGGPGGGAGGTLSLESPTVTLTSECEVTAVGGVGSSSATGQIGGDAGDGATAADAGSDGEYGGGGGGAAGFIRVRAATCPHETTAFNPPSICEAL